MKVEQVSWIRELVNQWVKNKFNVAHGSELKADLKLSTEHKWQYEKICNCQIFIPWLGK